MCILAGLITFISIILLAVHPETLQANVQEIFPNDTVLAVPHSGLDPNAVIYVTYSYQSEQDASDTLSLYCELCVDLQNIIEKRMLEDSYRLPWPENYQKVEIDHRYLLEGSTIEYRVNLTFATSENVPQSCYVRLLLRNSQGTTVHSVKFCNTTLAMLTVSSKVDSYYYVVVELTDTEGSIGGYMAHIQAIDVQVNGTQHYYDTGRLNSRPECRLDSQNSTTCMIDIKDKGDGYTDYRVCVLAVKETSSEGERFSSLIEYDIVSFGYEQITLISLICVGLVAFICTLGLSLSCCTRQGRRLRVARRMRSRLN